MNKLLLILLTIVPHVVSFGYSCKDPVRINRTPYEWTEYDNKHLDIAKKRCPSITKKRSPCLKYFIKRSKTDFSAICSGFWYKDVVK